MSLLDDDLPMQEVTRELLEADVQKACVDWARRRGWWARKLSSPANRGIMDYLFGMNTWVELVEFKRPGIDCKLSKTQKEEHKAARACGMTPVVMDDVQRFKNHLLRAEEYMRTARYISVWADIAADRKAMASGHERGDDIK